MWSFLTQSPHQRQNWKTSPTSSSKRGASWLWQWSDPKSSEAKSHRKGKRNALEADKFFRERERGAAVRKVERRISDQLKLREGELRTRLEVIGCSLALVLRPFEIHEQGRLSEHGDGHKSSARYRDEYESSTRYEERKLIISCQEAEAEIQRVDYLLNLWVERKIFSDESRIQYSDTIEGHIAGLKVLAALGSMIDELCPKWRLLRTARQPLKTIEDELRFQLEETYEGDGVYTFLSIFGETQPLEPLEETRPLEPLEDELESWHSFCQTRRSCILPLQSNLSSTSGSEVIRNQQRSGHQPMSVLNYLQEPLRSVENVNPSLAGSGALDRAGRRGVQHWKAGPGKNKDWRKWKNECRTSKKSKTVSEPQSLLKRSPNIEARIHNARCPTFQGKNRPEERQSAINARVEHLQDDLYDSL
jgi:hypothetical protein